MRDGCLVPTEPLAEVVRGFFDRWQAEYQPTGGSFTAEDEVRPIRAIEWLQQESGIPEATLIRIAQNRSAGTELRTADAIAAALHVEHLFYDGTPPTLPVYPNPGAPRALRAECCGGSLNGAASFSY